MQELVKIQDRNGKKAVSARELYEKLGYNTNQWKRWYEKNIIKNEFAVENEDWVLLDIRSSEQGRGNFGKDFALSLDFAKRLSMMARTEVGERIRQYFIEIEKHALKPLSTLDMLEMSIRQLREQESRVNTIENDVKQLKAASLTRPDYFTVVGYATLNNMRIGIQIASKIGQKASRLCKMNGYPMDEISDPRFGKVHAYPKFILQQVFNEAI
jgi:anti-repressor protein